MAIFAYFGAIFDFRNQVLEFKMSVLIIVKSTAIYSRKDKLFRTFEPFDVQRSNYHFQGWHKKLSD